MFENDKRKGGEQMALDPSTIRDTVAGDYEAMERVLSHYDDYITAMSYVVVRNEKRILVRHMDVEILECIRAKLLAKILDFDLTERTYKKQNLWQKRAVRFRRLPVFLLKILYSFPIINTPPDR